MFYRLEHVPVSFSSSLEECYNRKYPCLSTENLVGIVCCNKKSIRLWSELYFTLAEKIQQVIMIENRTGRLAKENQKMDKLCFQFYLLSLWFSSVASGDSY